MVPAHTAAMDGGCCVSGVPSAVVKTIAAMAPNFIGCDREQEFLLQPSLREWLPEDHLAWFVIDAGEAMDRAAFVAAYRADGHGRPAHDPAMMVALLMYAYARGQRSSRGIERGCFEDLALRFIAPNRQPDHTTIARFRQRHERAIAELFGQVLGLCAQAGLAGGAGPPRRGGQRARHPAAGPRCRPTRLSARRATTSAWPRRRCARPPSSTRPKMNSSAIDAATSC